MSLLSAVYRPQGVNSGGFGERVGKCSKGSPIILRIILNLPGSSPTIGLTFTATGLYFFPPFFLVVVPRCEVQSVMGPSVDQGGESGKSSSDVKESDDSDKFSFCVITDAWSREVETNASCEKPRYEGRESKRERS